MAARTIPSWGLPRPPRSLICLIAARQPASVSCSAFAVSALALFIYIDGEALGAVRAMIPSLAVLNSKGATLQGNKLTLTGVSSNSIVFADRPVRAAGHVLTSHFIKEWDVGNDSFAKDPPNATISVLSR